jgi:hypothetical protein
VSHVYVLDSSTASARDVFDLIYSLQAPVPVRPAVEHLELASPQGSRYDHPQFSSTTLLYSRFTLSFNDLAKNLFFFRPAFFIRKSWNERELRRASI